DMSAFPHRTTRSVYVVVLKKGEASPLAPESDEEKVAGEKKEGGAEGRRDGGTEGQGDKKSINPISPITIDFDVMGQRILALPIPARDYVAMSVAKSGVIFIAEGVGAGLFGGGEMTIHKFDLEKKKFDKAQENVTTFTLSANGEKMLIG